MTPADGQWGGPVEGGNVTGMIGQVNRREAHLAIDEITITGTVKQLKLCEKSRYSAARRQKIHKYIDSKRNFRSLPE